MEQTVIPQFVLYQVLDTIHAERQEEIKRSFERLPHSSFLLGEEDDASQFCERIPQDNVLSNLSLVHRSWTYPAQQTLGRIVFIRKDIEKVDTLLQPEHRTIYGPWTTAVALGFLALNHSCVIGPNIEREGLEFGLLEKFKSLHFLILSLPNLKHIYIRSYLPLLTRCANFTFREMIRNGTHLEELILQLMDIHSSPITLFNLDYIIENEDISDNLQSLSIRGASFSNEVGDSPSKRASFARLRSLSIASGGFSGPTDAKNLSNLLSALSARSDPHLYSFSILNVSYYVLMAFDIDLTPRQCTSLFEHLTTLDINSPDVADGWFTWIAPYCSRLKTFAFTASPFSNISYLLSHLPTTTQRLHLKICGDVKDPTHLTSIIQRVGDLLEITNSTFHAELKLFTLKVPKVKQMECYQDLRDAIRIYRSRMHECLIKMKAAYDESRIEFTFSQEEQKGFRRHDDEVMSDSD